MLRPWLEKGVDMTRAIGFLAILAAALNAGAAGFVVVCPVEGVVGDGMSVLVDRAVREASDADALIFEVDTPGGQVDSAIRISQRILDAPCPTIAYVKGMGGISAGALISYSCQRIVMAPESNLGTAQPVIPTSEGMMATGEKEVSFLRAKMRALAERNGYNPDIAEAMVDKDIELRSYVDGEGRLHVYRASPTGPTPQEQPPGEKQKTAELLREMGEKLPPELEPLKNALEQVIPAETTPQTAEKEPLAGPESLEETELVLASGKLLTLTAQEALTYGVISSTAESVEDVLAEIGESGAEIRRIIPTWSESLFGWLSSPLVSGLLLTLGIAGLYIEIKTPGFGIPGAVGVICLALFFGAHYLIGLAEWADLLLIVVGIGLVIVEVFILPGFGIVGGAGLVCIVFGLYLSLTGVTFPEYSWDYERLKDAGLSLTVFFITFSLLTYGAWKIFPYTPIYGRIIQNYRQDTKMGYTVQTTEQCEAAVGQKGVATSMLRPVGRGRFGGKTYQVVSRSEYMQKGTPIIIVQVDGNRYVVDKIEEDT